MFHALVCGYLLILARGWNPTSYWLGGLVSMRDYPRWVWEDDTTETVSIIEPYDFYKDLELENNDY